MKIMIWGCGRFGKQAYHYYNNNDNIDIVGFIDSESNKWGTYVFDKIVYSPKVLESFKGKVVIAVKNGYSDIQNVLKKNYGISEATLFKLEEQLWTSKKYSFCCDTIDESTIMIYFLGGLGNQMFQYALAKNYLLEGKKVVANLDHYLSLGKREFILCDVFKNITLTVGGNAQKKKIIEKNMDIPGKYRNFRINVENMHKGMEKSADMSLLDITGGVLYGFYQNCRYAEKIGDELRKDFIFGTNNDDGLLKVLKMIQKSNCVSVHIRRGDYIAENNRDVYGGICTLQYYVDAMKMIKDRADDRSCVFVFFSNDMDWVKESFKISNAIYIESSMFENYQDWYDMYLMSQCRHNIIANSTFSWWGAWLNQNQDKIVIAPKKWSNAYDYTEICPNDWITI